MVDLHYAEPGLAELYDTFCEGRPDFSFYFIPLLKRLLPDLLVMGRRREKLHYLLRLVVPPAAWLRAYYRLDERRAVGPHRLLHPLKLAMHYLAEIGAAGRVDGAVGLGGPDRVEAEPLGLLDRLERGRGRRSGGQEAGVEAELHAYRPVQAGLRFSANACGPSR